MKKEYVEPMIIIRILEDDVLSATGPSYELDDNETGVIIPPWFFGA